MCILRPEWVFGRADWLCEFPVSEVGKAELAIHAVCRLSTQDEHVFLARCHCMISLSGCPWK